MTGLAMAMGALTTLRRSGITPMRFMQMGVGTLGGRRVQVLVTRVHLAMSSTNSAARSAPEKTRKGRRYFDEISTRKSPQ